MDDCLVFPFILQVENDTVYVQRTPLHRVGFVVNCPCENCTEARKGLDLPQLIQRWENEASDREQERQRLIATRAEAEERAKALLFRILPKECVETLVLANYFEFESQHGRKYRISVGYSGNVFSGGKSYCCYLQAPGLPTFDHMIGQYLALKYNEDLFLATAY